jgi:dTDP-4-amino-4,6-dideoxygalactose transaminase
MPEIALPGGQTHDVAAGDPERVKETAGGSAGASSDRTVAGVAKHLWGLPCDMDDIVSVAERRGVAVIEDCAHALGAIYRGRPVGTFGDAAIFSFQTFKPLNAYGGGMAVVRDAVLAARVARRAEREPAPSLKRVRQRLWQGRVMRLATRPDVFKWTLFPLLYAGSRLRWSVDMYFWEAIRALDPLPEDYRERISNVQAAIALAGLARLDDWTAVRQRHARRMTERLDGVRGLRVPFVPPGRTHVFYQYCVYVPARDAVVDACLRRGVDLETLHVDVCPQLPLFGRGQPTAPGALQTTSTIQIPIYEVLTDTQLESVADAVRDAVLSHVPQPVAAMRASS